MSRRTVVFMLVVGLGSSSSNIKCSSSNGKDHCLFFLHADWGIGGYDGKQSSSRRLSVKAEEEEEEEEDEQDRELGGGGGNKQYYQHYTAASMSTATEKYGKPDAVFALGDNFYKNGVSTPTDSMYSTHFEQVYYQYSNLQVPWYTIPGNHDYGIGWEAMSYAQGPARNKEDSNWKTIGTNYTAVFDSPDGGTFAGIFVDTTTLSPQTNKFTNENGGISTATQEARIVDQATRLWRYYAEAVEKQANWIITLGHYPIYSQGDHGDNSYLEANLNKFIQYFGGQAYICGHDHINMHLQAGGTEYFIAGASSMNDYVKSSSSASMVWAGQGYCAFMVMQVWRDKIIYSYISNKTEVVYTYTQTNAISKAPTLSPTQKTKAVGDTTEVPTAYATAAPTTKPTSAPTNTFQRLSMQTTAVKVGGAAGFAALLLIVVWWFSKHRDCTKKIRSRPGMREDNGRPSNTRAISSRAANNSITALLGTSIPRSRSSTISDVVGGSNDQPSGVPHAVWSPGRGSSHGGGGSVVSSPMGMRSALMSIHLSPPEQHRKSRTMPI